MKSISPDLIVIKDLSNSEKETLDLYKKLYHSVSPDLTTVLNADDSAVVSLAGSETIRKGRTYYFSKNEGLKPQISKIGGVYSDGEKIQVYGMNYERGPLEIAIDKPQGHATEVSYLASLAAIMELNLNIDSLYKV